MVHSIDDKEVIDVLNIRNVDQSSVNHHSRREEVGEGRFSKIFLNLQNITVIKSRVPD